MSVQRYDIDRDGEEWPDVGGRWVLWEETRLLIEALRAVQLAHSRAVIDLPPALEGAINELIGPHPRDGGQP